MFGEPIVIRAFVAPGPKMQFRVYSRLYADQTGERNSVTSRARNRARPCYCM